MIEKIIDGFEAARITDLETVKDLVEAIYSTDDQTALEMFDVQETPGDDPERLH
jgi:hypothetical protein